MAFFPRSIWRLLASVLLLLCSLHLQAAEKSFSYLAALESISADELKLHVDYLADDKLEGREAGRRGGLAAGGYLEDCLVELDLRGAGADGSFFQRFPPNFRNVLARIEGTDPQLKDQFIIVSAHYDHVGYGTRRNSRGPIGYIHNGADDNASGTAGLLELAEAFTILDERPKRTVLFAFWDAEEKGLLGSKYWVAHPTIPLEHVAAEINMDMIGRLRNDRLVLFGTRSGYGWRRLASFQNDGPALRLDFSWTLKPNSDHYPFFRHDIPVLLLHTGLHDVYHTPRDDAKYINSRGMSRVIQFLFAVVYELADREQTPRFRKLARRETEFTRKRLAACINKPAGRLGVRWDPNEPAIDGLRLTHVASGSAAARAGFTPGDRIVDFAGRKIRSGEDLRAAVMRAENPATALVERPDSDQPLQMTVELSGKPMRLGISWRIDDAEPGTIILTHVVPGSPAAKAGLRPGDRVYQIGGEDFSDDRRFARLAQTLPEPLELLVERDGRLRTVVIYVETEPARRAA